VRPQHRVDCGIVEGQQAGVVQRWADDRSDGGQEGPTNGIAARHQGANEVILRRRITVFPALTAATIIGSVTAMTLRAAQNLSSGWARRYAAFGTRLFHASGLK